MNEQVFIQTINRKAQELGLNPLLLISGIEGLYTFREIQINAINYEFLDSLIITILALRIGDQFHALAEKNLSSAEYAVVQAAAFELKAMSSEEISLSSNPYFQSFAVIMNGKSTIRRYHEKALEVAALEVKKMQVIFGTDSISAIVIHICKTQLNDVIDLGSFFGQ